MPIATCCSSVGTVIAINARHTGAAVAAVLAHLQGRSFPQGRSLIGLEGRRVDRPSHRRPSLRGSCPRRPPRGTELRLSKASPRIRSAPLDTTSRLDHQWHPVRLGGAGTRMSGTASAAHGGRPGDPKITAATVRVRVAEQVPSKGSYR